MIRLTPVLLLAGFVFGPSARAFNVPKGLTDADRREVTRTLGVNSATKLLTNPYPLGGYAGWEVGYSLEVVNVRGLREVGVNERTRESNWRVSRLTFGKGLYDDIDVFVSFVPPVGSMAVSDYGGFVRWTAFQAAFLPINLSVLAHANQMNFANRLSHRNLGVDLIVGVNADGFAFYFGGGLIQARGTFTGPDEGGTCGPDCTVTDVSVVNTVSRTVSSSMRVVRLLAGASYHFEPAFVAVEVDRVRESVYSVKAGVRF